MSALAVRVEKMLEGDPAGRPLAPATREMLEEILRRERWKEDYTRRFPQPPGQDPAEMLASEYRLKRLGMVGKEEGLP